MSCTNCGFGGNGDGAKFCGNCGKPLANMNTPLLGAQPQSHQPYPPAAYPPPQQQQQQPPYPPNAGQAPGQEGGEFPGSSAPPLNEAPPESVAFEGFGKVGLTEMNLPPPPSYSEFTEAPERSIIPQPALITEEQAKQALLEYVGQKCCYGKGAAQKMKVESIVSSNAYHYFLETFDEKRTVVSAFVPYMGEPVDGPERGPPPHAWSILATPKALFQNQQQDFEVPHTAQVRVCHGCLGSSHVRCGPCMGMGRERCTWCGGSGRRNVTHHDQQGHHHHHERCDQCFGTGFRKCMRCLGSGRVICPTCTGRGALKFYLKLTVKWENHVDHKYVEKTDLPDHLIKDAPGQTLLTEENQRVAPLMSFPVADINQGSQFFLQEHNNRYGTNGVILRQRQVLRQVPVSEVAYKYKSETYRYFVYGSDHRVFDDEYSQKYCWGACNIL